MMENINQILNLLPNDLKNYIGVDVIESNLIGEIPIYPFLTYKVVSSFIPDKFMPVLSTKVIDSSEAEFDKDIEISYIEDATTVISITVHELKPANPMLLAIKSREFFVTPQLFPRIIENYGVIKEVTVVQPRDSLLTEETFIGFDVKIEWENVTTVTERTIEAVEVTILNERKIYPI